MCTDCILLKNEFRTRRRKLAAAAMVDDETDKENNGEGKYDDNLLREIDTI